MAKVTVWYGTDRPDYFFFEHSSTSEITLVSSYADNDTLNAGAGNNRITISTDHSNNTITAGTGASVLGDISNVAITKKKAAVLTLSDDTNNTLTLSNSASLKVVINNETRSFATNALVSSDGKSVTLTSAFGGAFKAGTYNNVNVSTTSKGTKITGNDSANSIIDGAGANYISGAAGNDSLLGDAGADKFYYAKGAGKDVIFRFDDENPLTLDNLDFTSSYKNEILTLKVTDGAVTFKEFTATTFNINDKAYKISGKKLVVK